MSATPSTEPRPGVATVVSVAVAALLLGCAVVALGRPDPGQAADFLTSGRPGYAGALAAVEVLVWALVIVLVVVQLAGAMRRSVGVAAEVRRRRLRSRLALLVGLLVFTGGAIRHQSPVATLCCGDIARADRLLR